MSDKRVVWICDRKRGCWNCGEMCHHTTDPDHAVNGPRDPEEFPEAFRKYGDRFVEVES